MRKIAGIGVIVLGASLLFYYYGVREEPHPGPVAATITYSETGFQPTEVTIKRGEAVRWVNESERAMWPAAAVHPTHSLYPEKSSDDCLGSSFDACGDIPPGSGWEFTFHEGGDWRFHDHIAPSRTGVVHVK